MIENSVLPFLKWPGGKRWLASELVSLIRPRLSGIYYEPFLGGGAVFFELNPERSVLSDINGELVNVYVQVKKNHEAILRRLRRLQINADVYRRIRSRRLTDSLMRAVDFLYLNRTAWGGIYRVNASGEFNVPFGGGQRTPEPLWKNHLISRAARALENADILVSDFEAVVDRARTGDVVYCDPTYTVAHDQNGFVRYNEKNFSWTDQVRLAEACNRAARRGACVFVSNAHHSSVRGLYPYAKKRILRRKSLVSIVASSRCEVSEYLLMLD